MTVLRIQITTSQQRPQHLIRIGRRHPALHPVQRRRNHPPTVLRTQITTSQQRPQHLIRIGRRHPALHPVQRRRNHP
ncbi:hypothetical protein, partial [Streptomyces sp. NPDC091294]|uniref:hypothetical protein n=1 Tax=Streptomyces sp. NPDC091294 TaxID=3365992 RepID=UPI00381C114D